MTEQVTSHFATRAGIARDINVINKAGWDEPEHIVKEITLPAVKSKNNINGQVKVDYSRLKTNNGLFLSFTDSFDRFVATFNEVVLATHPQDSVCTLINANDFDKLITINKLRFVDVLPYVDVKFELDHNLVNLLKDKPQKPLDYKYLPSSNFNINDELMGFTSHFSEPFDFDKLKTPLSPVGSPTTTVWNANGDLVTFRKTINYGYSVNKFFVGGGPRVIYPIDEEALEPPPNTNTPIKVIKIVNDVSIVVLPARTPLAFGSIQVSRQIDSFAWSCDITLLDQYSYDLVKPTVSNTVDIEVNINGTIWNLFVSKGSKQQVFGDQRFTIKAFSYSALLQSVYAGTNSFTNGSPSTPLALIDSLIGVYGFTATWGSLPSWTVAQHDFSYQNKSPIEGVSSIASSIGAVVYPHLTDKQIIIKPWCETSPWLWSGLVGLPELDANLSYEVSQDYSPQTPSNGIYVTGQENGVAVKCVITGTAGNVLLPSVSDKLLTDTAAAKERGRIELAKSGHKEVVPITTYIDENETLLMPGDMVKVNNVEVGSWNGLVTQTTITVDNSGLEVYQTLNVIRHYE